MPNDITAIATTFQKLHDEAGTFVIPNPWDRGTARMFKSLGFKALATTSAGFDFADGRKEGTATLDDVVEHCRLIAEATDLPVNADSENLYAETPEGVAENVQRLAETGIAGCSIEDVNVYGPGPYGDGPIYDQAAAVERVAAAAEAARNLGRPFVLTGRAENYLHGRPDLADTIKRLQAYQDAGADVLYAPGPKTADDIRSLITSLDRPVNILAGLPGMDMSVTDLTELGAKRISIGANLFRTAFGAALRGAQEIANEGTFSYAASGATFQEISALFDD